MPSPLPHSSPRYFPHLDGLRGLAALCVVIAHFNPGPQVLAPGTVLHGLMTGWRYFALGNLAVVCFFTLSAFLLTYLACHEHDATGSFSISRFFARRILRIWPLYFCVVAIAYLIYSQHASLPPEFAATAQTWRWLTEHFYLYATFTSNWSQTFNLIGGHVDASPSALRVLWSIGVEEQFYLVYPLFFMLFLRRPRNRLVLGGGLILLAMAFRAWFSTLTPSSSAPGPESGMYYATFSYVGVFLAGCAAGGLAARTSPTPLFHWLQKRWLGPAILVGCIVAGMGWSSALWFPYNVYSILSYPVIGAFFAALLLWSCHHDTHPWVRALSNPLLVRLGILSYGIYVWHAISNLTVAVAFGDWVTNSPPPLIAWLWLGTSLLAAVAFALVSHWLVEQPFLRLQAHFRARLPAPALRATRPTLAMQPGWHRARLGMAPLPAYAATAQSRRAWFLVLGVYVALYSFLLWRTDGYPYVYDNNESYSSLWHARSLYENGVAHTKGLTDEVFSTSPAASPYVHTHQGNWPRLYTFVLYALGCHSISSQIWITTFTVGLAGLYFAFRFLAGLTNHRYAAIACLVMMTNYLLFTQWQVSLYNVWHLFFFFSSLLCMRALGCPQRPWLWRSLAFLNFAAFFYWEYVFTAFVVSMCGLYALLLYWRQPRVYLRSWLLVAGGGALAAAVLLTQLTAYMGWANVMEDVRLTLTARNTASDQAMLERVTSFYRDHKIIFWHNFVDAAPLRTVAAFLHSLIDDHVQYYSPPLVFASLIVFGGWVIGSLRWPGGIQGRRPFSPIFAVEAPITRSLQWLITGSLAKWVGLTVVLQRVLANFLTQNGLMLDSSPDTQPETWIASAITASLLVILWTGGPWGWARLGWWRLGLGALLAESALAVQRTLNDYYQAGLWPADATNSSLVGVGLWGLIVCFGSSGLALSLAVMGNWQVLGRKRTSRLTGLLAIFACSAVAYVFTYRIFTGYVYSGYLQRQVPLLVFVTDLLLALVLYATLEPLWRTTRLVWPSLRALLAGLRRNTLARSQPGTAPLAMRSSRYLPIVLAMLLGGGLLAALAGQWGRLQAAYIKIIPPSQYVFLAELDKPAYRGKSLVATTYPAPMAARTGAWGYADPTFFSGRLTLTAQGFNAERDSKYLWFADAQTNPVYLRPDLAIAVLQTPNFEEALAAYQTTLSAPDDGALFDHTGLVRRASGRFQTFLQHKLLYSENRRLGIVALDWDFPPYLKIQSDEIREFSRSLTLNEKLAISAHAREINRHWRVEVEYLGAKPNGPPPVTLTCDDRFVELPGNPALVTIKGDHLRLHLKRSPEIGSVRITINNATETMDLSTLPEVDTFVNWSAAHPNGRNTFLPLLPPGFYVRTQLFRNADQDYADIGYDYKQQDNVPEAGTTIRLYTESHPDQWTIADCITYLGPHGIPVRLSVFRRGNPDLNAEYARAIAAGDRRSFEHWLTHRLNEHPEEWQRPGIVQACLPTVGATPTTSQNRVTRRFPLPSKSSSRWQFSVSPGTQKKVGPEYLGLPFSNLILQGRPTAVVDFASSAYKLISTQLPFGELHLKIRFPHNKWPQSEPILGTGLNEAGDLVYVIYDGPDRIRLGFDHWFKGGPVTKPIPIDFNKEHDLVVSIGSLFPAAEDVVFIGVPAEKVRQIKERIRVTLNGKVVLEADASCYESAPDQVTVGRNLIHGTSCGPAFTGKIVSHQRVWPDLPE